MDAVVVPGEPVVDRRQMTQNPAHDTGLLGDLPHGRLLGGLRALQVPLGQAPLQAAAPIPTGDDRRDGAAGLHIDNEAAGARLIDHRQTVHTRPPRQRTGAGSASAMRGHKDTLSGRALRARWDSSRVAFAPHGRLGPMTQRQAPAHSSHFRLILILFYLFSIK